MLLRLHEIPKPLGQPITTGAKRLAAWKRSSARQPRTVPGLDMQALQAKYGPEQAYAPQMHECAVRVQIGSDASQLERRAKDALTRFIDYMAKNGFDLYTPRTPTLRPGMYPACNPFDGLQNDLSARDYIWRAWFTCRAPKLIRTEIPIALREPIAARGATKGGD